MGIFFDRERALLAAIAREQDLAATDPVRRAMWLKRARRQAGRLPQSSAEKLLLSLG